MDNPKRGEVSFEADGKTYKMHFSTNAICALEEALDQDIGTLLDTMDGESPSMRVMRALFQAGLSDNHPQVTVYDAGAIIDEITLAKAGELISSAVEKSFLAAEAGSAKPGNRKR